MKPAVAMLLSFVVLRSLGSLACPADLCPTQSAVDNDPTLEEFNRTMALGETELSRGEYAKALEHFLAADAVDFSEVPDYRALPKIAEAKCRLGDSAGRAILADMRCILDVEVGLTPCFVGEETHWAIGHPNPELTPTCFQRMCGEIYLAYYDSPSEAVRARVKELRREVERVDVVCRSARSLKESEP